MSLKVGIQLYSVRNSMEKDPIGTIKKVAEIGYKNIEVANHHADKDFGVGFGVSPKELLSLLAPYGAKVVNAHIFPFDDSNIDEVLAYHKAIGNKNITCAIDFFTDRAHVLERCAYYNRVAEKCAQAGMHFVYHNHFEEFQALDGEVVFDTIANNTDPELVSFELDSFWVMRGGVDPVDVMKKYGSRIKLLHQKDFSKDTKEPVNIYEKIDPAVPVTMEMLVEHAKPETFTEIGKGILDIQRIINAANDYTAAEYIILEQDYTALEELESINVSMNSFRRFSGIDWA